MAGAPWLLSSCGPTLGVFKAPASEKEILVPVEKFPAGQQQLLVSSPSLANSILLVRRNDSIKALYLECTHEYAGLTATSSKIVCSLHGSVFDFDGNVVKEPALLPLKQYKVISNSHNHIIQLT